MRAAGIVDSLKVYSAGQPCRIVYTEARNRYYPLMTKDRTLSDRHATIGMLNIVLGKSAKFLPGKTMVFLTDAQLNALEKTLHLRRSVAATDIQVSFSWEHKILESNIFIRCTTQT